MYIKRIKCRCGCGRLLKPNLVREQIPNPSLPGFTKDGKVIEVSGYGYANNGFFDTLRCGFWYAVNKQKTLGPNPRGNK